MRDSVDFLSRLDLDHGADVRAIRRAYAREVKLIDQQRNPEGFQLLREAYERALQWASQAEEESAPQAAPPVGLDQDASHAAPGPSFDETLQLRDPHELADEAFIAFGADCARLNRLSPAATDTQWEEALRTRLDDEQLLNINARLIFEARVAHLLAQGWQPGHETLLFVASGVFEWSKDRRRLQQFGGAGALLDRAIDERAMFDAQPDDARRPQVTVIVRLRKASAPNTEQLKRDIMYLEHMLGRFPNMMSLTVDPGAVRRWRSAYASMSAAEKEFVATTKKQAPTFSPGWILLAVVILFNFCRPLFNSPDKLGPPPRFAPQIAPQIAPQFYQVREQWQMPSTAPASPMLPLPVALPATASNGPLMAIPEPVAPPGTQTARASRETIDDISERIAYQPRSPIVPGKREVAFLVELDRDGAVKYAGKMHDSMDVLYDDAVREAILQTKPFPPATARRLMLTFSMTIPEPNRAPAPEAPSQP
ncbi:MAG: TonB C-terminal domain-containing protein [Pseudomonadota bacterium]